jgi:uncharacterized repeat protein (TIGR01451 family)
MGRFKKGLRLSLGISSALFLLFMVITIAPAASASSVISKPTHDRYYNGGPSTAISLVMTGDTQTRIGDMTTYTVVIENTGTETLYKQSIVDSLVGNLDSYANVISNTAAASVAHGATAVIVYNRTVLPGDPDPLFNEVTVIYDTQVDLLGTEVGDTATWSVNIIPEVPGLSSLGIIAMVSCFAAVIILLTLRRRTQAQ